ncbi:O-antigen polymerase [Gloeocapsa sp. BRSZ]
MLDSAYLVLLALIVFIEIFREKSSKFDFLTLFNIYFALMYPLPAFLLAFDFANAVSSLGLGISLYTNKLQTVLAIFVGYFLVVISFYSKSAIDWGKKISLRTRRNNSVLIYAIALLLFSSISIYVYGLQYGSFINALSQASLIRARAVEGGTLVFFKHFTLFAMPASYLLGAVVFFQKNKKINPLLIIAVFVFSVIVAVIAITLTGGRGYLINYFLCFYLVYILKSKKISWTFNILFGIFAVSFLLYGKVFFFSLTALPQGLDAVINTFVNTIENSSSNGFNFYQFMYNFQFPVHSLEVALYRDYEFRWFADILYAIASLIPQRLLGVVPPETIMYYNTQYILGNNDFSIPTGFLAFGVYSMWWPGLFIVAFTYGWIGRCLQTMLIKHVNQIFWMPFMYTAIAQIWMDFLSSDPETFIQGYFAFLTGIGLLFLLYSNISVAQQKA